MIPNKIKLKRQTKYKLKYKWNEISLNYNFKLFKTLNFILTFKLFINSYTISLLINKGQLINNENLFMIGLNSKQTIIRRIRLVIK